MPTNVTPEYRKAEQAFRAAKSVDEKIERLEDMIALLPKHKSTDHLYADLKRRMSKLRRQQESSGKKRSSGSYVGFSREGTAQVILVGPPNSGKSSILHALTNAHPEIGDYPFTTNHMQPGMVPYEDIQIQMVDTPPVTSDFMHIHLLGLVRRADAVLKVADLSKDSILDDMDAVFKTFSMRHVRFVREKNLKDRDSIQCMVIANKVDAAGASERIELLREMLEEKLDILPISCIQSHSVSELPKMLFRWLQIVRVYPKIPHFYNYVAGRPISKCLNNPLCFLIFP